MNDDSRLLAARDQELAARRDLPLHERLPILTFRGVAIDRSAHLLFVGEDAVEVTRSEFALIVALAERPRMVISQRDLVRLIDTTTTRVVVEIIRRIRKVLPQDSITTVRGVGYRWDLPVVGPSPYKGLE